MPKVYKVTFINEEKDLNATVNCADDQYILEAGEDAGLNLPYSCKAGACSSCTGKLIEGTADQSEQGFLEDDQIAEGFVLTCVAYPSSDCKIQSHAEDDLF
nr:ferredoxin [Ishige okamurae]